MIKIGRQIVNAVGIKPYGEHIERVTQQCCNGLIVVKAADRSMRPVGRAAQDRRIGTVHSRGRAAGLGAVGSVYKVLCAKIEWRPKAGRVRNAA